MLACAEALAGAPPTALPMRQAPDEPRSAAAPAPDAPAATATAAPDDEFLEFLGADDVGDPALWAFLKKSAKRKDSIPLPPPQDAKQ